MNIVPRSEASTVQKVLEVIRDGGVVALPTDTVYGLVCSAQHEAAIRKLFAIKQRSHANPIAVFVADVAMARAYAEVSDDQAAILAQVWPGGVTALVRSKENLPKILTAGSDLIGMRVPDDAFIGTLVREFGLPLAQSSANPSGWSPATSAGDVVRYFESREQKPDLVVDGNHSRGGQREASTVIDFTKTPPSVVREGAVPLEKLSHILT